MFSRIGHRASVLSIISVSALAALAPAASGQTIAFSNFVNTGSSAPYDPNGEVYNLSASPSWGIGYRFTSRATGEVAWIDVGLFAASANGAGSITSWEIRTEERDQSVGDTMAAFSDSLTFPFGEPVRLTPSASIVLQEGVSYWLTVRGVLQEGESAQWFMGDTDPALNDFFAIPTSDTDWFAILAPVTQGAYEIVVVPAPTGAAAMLIGFAVLARRRRV